MRRALVTGAHGVVGRWLVDALLARGAEVTVLVRTPGRRSALVLDGLEARCSVVTGDVTDADAVGRAVTGCDALFHLAAQSVVGEAMRAPAATFDTNVRGTWTVLEACRDAGVERVVVAGSGRAGGGVGDAGAGSAGAAGGLTSVAGRAGVPASGAGHAGGVAGRAGVSAGSAGGGAGRAGPYEASKACAELVAASYASAHRLRVATARTSNVYGPGDLQRSRLVPGLVEAALAGRAPAIRSDGTPTRDFLFATDAAAAYLALADALDDDPGLAGAALDVGAGQHTVRDVAELLVDLAGSAARPQYATGGGDHQAVDASRLRALTGWAPRVDLREGLERTLAWHREHPGALP